MWHVACGMWFTSRAPLSGPGGTSKPHTAAQVFVLFVVLECLSHFNNLNN